MYYTTILPFSGTSFFILSFSYILGLVILRPLLKKYVKYKYLLFVTIILYLVIFTKKDIRNPIFLFFVFSYIIYYIHIINQYKEALFTMIIVALPMILFKMEISPFTKIVGISYITFRTSQAIVDSNNTTQLDFCEFFCFLVFPFTLIAGPIDRSYRFKEDLDNAYDNLTAKNFLIAWEYFIIGVLLNKGSTLVSQIVLDQFDAESTQGSYIFMNSYGYFFYLFFNFAGYSYMALGLSKMIGINIPLNFDNPLLAKNPQDFWRRFHITLGAWLTDYIFKPLYKFLYNYKFLKKHRLLMQNIAIMTTFLFMGFWNGFKWYYIASGMCFGIYSVIHNIYVAYSFKFNKDVFQLFPEYISINIKRFLMFNAGVWALYLFSGRIPHSTTLALKPWLLWLIS